MNTSLDEYGDMSVRRQLEVMGSIKSEDLNQSDCFNYNRTHKIKSGATTTQTQRIASYSL